jgi:uronate dehydrogenase
VNNCDVCSTRNKEVTPMDKIIITGASGNIGRVLVNHLKKNYELTLVDINFNDVEPGFLSDTIVKELDLTLSESWNGLLEGIDYVIHSR